MHKDFRSVMESEFVMINLGLMRDFLGIEFHESKDNFFISQSKCENEVLKRFNMENFKEAPTLVITILELSKGDDRSNADPKNI